MRNYPLFLLVVIVFPVTPGQGGFCNERRFPGCYFTVLTASGVRRGLSGECLVEVADQVFGTFEADRQADYVGRGRGRLTLLVAQLAVGRRGGVEDQAAGVADIGEVREQLDVLD